MNVIRGTAYVLAVDASSAHVCIDEWRPTASTPVFPAKNRRSEIAVTLNTKLKRTIFIEFPGY